MSIDTESTAPILNRLEDLLLSRGAKGLGLDLLMLDHGQFVYSLLGVATDRSCLRAYINPKGLLEVSLGSLGLEGDEDTEVLFVKEWLLTDEAVADDVFGEILTCIGIA